MKSASCSCGKNTLTYGGPEMTVTEFRCGPDCTPWHEAGWLAALDEWHHERFHGSRLWRLMWRPICNWRDYRLTRVWGTGR